MVGLRERKSRPSYALMAEGLENLSDNDSHSAKSVDSRGGEDVAGSDSDDGASGSAFGSASGSEAGSGPEDGGDDSAEESVFSDQGSDEEDGRGVKKGKGKGKGGADAQPGIQTRAKLVKGVGEVRNSGNNVSAGGGKGKGKAVQTSEGIQPTTGHPADHHMQVDNDDERNDEMDIDPELLELDSMDPDPRLAFHTASPSVSVFDRPGDGGDGLDSQVKKKLLRGRAKAQMIQYGLPAGVSSSSGGVSVGTGSGVGQASNSGHNSEINLIPPAYRDLIRKHAEIASAGKAINKADYRKEPRPTRLLHAYLPFGPTSPFVMHLKKEPEGREKAEVIKRDGSGSWAERRKRRQKRQGEVVKSVTLVSPWQTWEGEGWYPEMCRKEVGSDRSGTENGEASRSSNGMSGGPVNGKGKEKAKEHAYLSRDEVRLGLDKVGRYKPDELRSQLLSDRQVKWDQISSSYDAEPYLPTTMDSQGNPYITCMMGPHNAQAPVNLGAFDTKSIGEFNASKSGFVFSAGGPIWGLDWCPYPDAMGDEFHYAQYLAVSPLPHIETRPALGEKWPRDTTACIQIWSITPPNIASDGKVIEESRMKCEMVLCVKGGSAMDLKWMPLGAWDEPGGNMDVDGVPKLGILAAVQLDGSTSLYSVPHPGVVRRIMGVTPSDPKPLFLRVDEPLLRLEIPDAMCSCIDWISGTRIVAGLSNGHVAAWDVVESLTSQSTEAPLPALYFCVNQSAIRSIAVGRAPPVDDQGEPVYSLDPVYLISGSYDASATLVDLRDPTFSYSLLSTRAPVYAVGWASQLANPLYAESDHVLAMHRMRGSGLTSFSLSVHRGPILDIATSDYHCMAVTASADGSVLLTTYQQGFYRRKGMGLVYQRLYEVDYDLHTGQYRMLDNFLPEEMSLDAASAGHLANKKKGYSANDPSIVKTGNWPVQVGIHRAAWNDVNLGKGGWLVSGGASGLGRVDFVEGRFARGRVPGELDPERQMEGMEG